MTIMTGGNTNLILIPERYQYLPSKDPRCYHLHIKDVPNSIQGVYLPHTAKNQPLTLIPRSGWYESFTKDTTAHCIRVGIYCKLMESSEMLVASLGTTMSTRF